MSSQNRSQTAGAGSALLEPIVVMPALLTLAYLLITAFNATVGRWVVPINVLAGFAYSVQPLYGITTTLILCYGLWWCARVGIGGVVIAAFFLFFAPLLVAFISGYVVANFVPFEVASVPENFYGLFLAQSAISGASLLLVMAIAAPVFRNFWSWLIFLVLWSGGATLLFWAYRNYMITVNVYAFLAPVMRILAFITVGYEMQQALQRPAR